MAKTVDLRTYLLLERAFVRRLQRSWRQQSALTYAKIHQACLVHRWDEARRLVPDLDMAEVGTENREWITYMLLSCAVFGAGMVSRGKPSFVGVGSFDTFLKQVTNNFLRYLEFNATSQVQAEALQSIAEDEAKTKALKWDEAKHPRDKEGQFTDGRPEGAGPAYDDYKRLYQATLDTSDAFIAAKAAHRVNVDRAMKQLTDISKTHPDMSVEEIEAKVWSDPAYIKTKLAAQRAKQIFDETIDEYQVKLVAMKKEVVTNLAAQVARNLGVDPDIIHVVDKTPPEFTVGGIKFKEGGHFSPSTGQIEINVRNLDAGDTHIIKGIAAHETVARHVPGRDYGGAKRNDGLFDEKAGFGWKVRNWYRNGLSQQARYSLRCDD